MEVPIWLQFAAAQIDKWYAECEQLVTRLEELEEED